MVECGAPGDVVDDASAPADVAPDGGTSDAVTPDAGADSGAAEKVVGAACAADDDCPTAWCATTESLTAMLRRDYAVTGGLCTLLFCAGDAECGAGAACRDTGGFEMCTETCTSYIGCRYTQGWACAAPAASAGAVGPATCLPEDGLALTRCGDGVCDESERYVADACPGDCPEPPVAPFPSGGPCATLADCSTRFCLDKTFLSIALPQADVDVPNGYCSSNPLANACVADADCGEGGICADASALAGQPLSLCLHECVTDGDCRYAEGYRCFATGDAADAQRGCLPASVVAAIRCGDGTCDPSEAANPEQCSELDFQGDCQ